MSPCPRLSSPPSRPLGRTSTRGRWTDIAVGGFEIAVWSVVGDKEGVHKILL